MVDVSGQGRHRPRGDRRRPGAGQRRGRRAAARRGRAQGRRARRRPDRRDRRAPSGRRTSSRCATRSRCTASTVDLEVADDARRDHRDRPHRGPHRRRDGGADRGRRRRPDASSTWSRRSTRARGHHRRPGPGQDRRARTGGRGPGDAARRRARRVVTVSDRAAAGAATRTAPARCVAGLLRELGFAVDGPVVVPDEVDAVERGAARGGRRRASTSSSPPAAPGCRRATSPRRRPGRVLEREVPGIAEAVRRYRARPRADGDAVARRWPAPPGARWSSTCPGRPAGCATASAVLAPVLAHAVAQLRGGDH